MKHHDLEGLEREDGSHLSNSISGEDSPVIASTHQYSYRLYKEALPRQMKHMTTPAREQATVRSSGMNS